MSISRHSVQSIALTLSLATLGFGCSDSEEPIVHDPAAAEHVAVDRFSDSAATLMRRSADSSLPGPNEPINFDQGPFITRGLGPNGQSVRYYNFDVQPTTPAPIYVLFREGEQQPVAGQLNIVDVIPGDPGYNDFWQVVRVTVPADYAANEAASLAELQEAGYAFETTDTLVNCPVVPEGSTATLRAGGESNQITRGWYKGQIVHYFSFVEASLTAAGGSVPVSPIFVTFNKNPNDADVTSGPPSGFVTEPDGEQTHNVLATLPGDAGYSPLWSVSVYDNQYFDAVADIGSLGDAVVLANAVANVNCPVVEIEQ